jgi:peptide/nickel transport system permease protein
LAAACLILAAAIGGALAAIDPGSSWAPASLSAPLGFDEFGRNLLLTLAAAGLLSLTKAAVITSIILGLALAAGQVLSRSARAGVGRGLQLLVDSVEAVPPVLWVLAIFAALREPRLALVGIAFGLVTLPTAIALTAGEIRRLRHEPFVEFAYGLGLSEWQVTWRHLLPNAMAVLSPFAFQVIGVALAVDGAVGIIGMGSRTELDLGAFLLRGQENFVLQPQLMIATLAFYVAIYAGLSCLARRIATRHAAG